MYIHPVSSQRLVWCAAALIAVISGCSGGDGGVGRIDQACMAAVAGTYPGQSTSPYILPYSVGETYLAGQGNCTNFSHRADINQQFAYDLIMPIGTTLVASRGGVVIAVEQSFRDATRIPGEENYVYIQHDHGTIGRYIHLTMLGALVQPQDIVSQGDAIALSGDSGNSEVPHLHFDVLDGPCLPQQSFDCLSLPVNFSNTAPHINGLVEGEFYTAEPF